MKSKVDIIYDLYLHNFNCDNISQLADIESKIFPNLTDEQIEYLEKVKYSFFRMGFNLAKGDSVLKKEILELIEEVKKH